jgi:hypothetical protein
VKFNAESAGRICLSIVLFDMLNKSTNSVMLFNFIKSEIVVILSEINVLITVLGSINPVNWYTTSDKFSYCTIPVK